MNNTLLLGNGFSRAVYPNTPLWDDVFDKDMKEKVSNNTLLYEYCLLNTNQPDNRFKSTLTDKIRFATQADEINQSVQRIDSFGSDLIKHNISNVISTNIDKGIENLLIEKNGFIEEWPEDIGRDAGEKIYNIRRNVKISNGTDSIKIWKIHGDIDNIASISFGFDQYCGSLAKMKEYLSGKYLSSSGLECRVSIANKCINENAKLNHNQFVSSKLFDGISWIELFFNSNVYIAGFGLAFSEIDIWWLLNKRFRLKKQQIPVENRVVFLFNQIDKSKEDFNEKIELLKTFDVEFYEMKTNEEFLSSMFSTIQQIESLK